MNKFSIKAFCKKRGSSRLTAFTVAEMLLVLLIVSFLIIAIPPLVNKKIAKKVIRGEHGRYECWKDTNGDTYEYLATERHGIGALFMGAGGLKGRKLGPNERCRFKPAEMAPTAPYFVMQIIGGGGGGAYAPYNYHDEAYNETINDEATVQALAKYVKSFEANYNNPRRQKGSDFFNVRYTYAHDKDGPGGTGDIIDNSAFKFNSGVLASNRVTGTSKYAGCNAYKWVYDYFPPVKSNATFNDYTICSGHGPRGGGDYIEITSPNFVLQKDYCNIKVWNEETQQYDYSTTAKLNDLDNELCWRYHYNKQTVPISAGNYGNRGGYGYCMKADTSKLYLGRKSSGPGAYFEVKTNSPIDSYDYAAYYKSTSMNNNNVWSLLEYTQYKNDNITRLPDYGVQELNGSPTHAYWSLFTEIDKFSDNLYTVPGAESKIVKMCPYTSTGSAVYSSPDEVNNTPKETVSGGAFNDCQLMLAEVYANNHNNPEQSFYLNYKNSDVYSTTFNVNPSFSMRQFNPENESVNDMGITVTAATYDLTNGPEESDRLISANIEIPGGDIGCSYNDNDCSTDGKDRTLEDVITKNPNYNTNVWANAGSNQKDSINGRKYAYPTRIDYGRDLFPRQIIMRRTATVDSNTYGYAGMPGESVGMSLAKLTGTLEFDIGDGGASGVFADRSGKMGTRTIVWRKKEGTPDSLKCEFGTGANINTPNDNRCSAIAVAGGGRGYKTGAMGKKFVVRGDRTCADKLTATQQNNGEWSVFIDGCLDDRVGPFSDTDNNGGNSFRFAESSNFYIIPELDNQSSTPSAIEEFFEHKGLNMPGSGGDGGYSFLAKIEDTEVLVAENHTNMTSESLASIGAGNWTCATSNGTSTCTAGRNTGLDEMLDLANYRCYKKNDVVHKDENNLPIHNLPEDRKKPVLKYQHNTAFCEPDDGMPGAVVIVW